MSSNLSCNRPGEEVSGSKIERSGIGKRLQENIPLALQVEDYLEYALQIERSPVQSTSWRELLMNHIESIKQTGK